ncbi:MAG: hypothetical protein ACJAXV_000599 [Bacteroidia bacterium]|jgi:hypothetical protein
MKKLGLALIVTLCLQACKESLPPIDFSAPLKVLIDSTYRLEEDSIPEADKRGILIEDLTGVRCVACPNAAEAAFAIKNNDKDNVVVVVSIYPTDPRSLTDPVDDAAQDLRTEVAQLIGTNIFKFSNILPGGGVNRTPQSEGDPINVGYAQWQSLANKFEGGSAIVNLEITQEEVNDSTLDVFGVFEFTADAEANPFVSIFLLENAIPHPQKTLSGTDEGYIHEHILRKAYTPYNGTPLFNSASGDAVRGKGLKKGWEIVIPNYVNREKASLVFVINYNDGDNKQVIQCKEVKLKK